MEGELSDQQKMAQIFAQNSNGQNKPQDYDMEMMDWISQIAKPQEISQIFDECGSQENKYHPACHIISPQKLELSDIFLQTQRDAPIQSRLAFNKGSEKNHRFINWGQTVNHYYDHISFPKTKEQVRKCVQNAIHRKQSIRGSGVRHSWSNIFSDPQNMMVSFYPYKQSVGQSEDIQKFAAKMLNNHKQLNNPDSLYSIIQMPIPHNFKLSPGKEKLVKIGAGVSNDQLRRWCIKHRLQYDANVIMVQVNFCGGLGTCSHGSGIKNPPLCDSIVEIEFVNCKGEFQTINKWEHPELIGSAAGSLGLIGLYVSVTIQMGKLKTAHYHTRKLQAQKVIPKPDSNKHSQYFETFKQECNSSYSQWFYFTQQSKKSNIVFSNIFTAQQRKQHAQVEHFPPYFIKKLSQIGTKAANFGQQISKKSIFHLGIAKHFVHMALKNPYFAFPGEVKKPGSGIFHPKKMIKFNYMDAIHFQRGIQNFRCRDMELQIQVPIINGQMDYALIQRAWWAAKNYIDSGKVKDVIDLALEMRLFKGSKCSLAPEIDYDVVCSIQILRTMTDNKEQEGQWKHACQHVYNLWANLKDSNGKPVILRPHWGKEWDIHPQIKKSILSKEGTNSMVPHFKNFLQDYKKIGQIGGWSVDQGLDRFSNKIYNQFINEARK